jgi:hypothetical protein
MSVAVDGMRRGEEVCSVQNMASRVIPWPRDGASSEECLILVWLRARRASIGRPMAAAPHPLLPPTAGGMARAGTVADGARGDRPGVLGSDEGCVDEAERRGSTCSAMGSRIEAEDRRLAQYAAGSTRLRYGAPSSAPVTPLSACPDGGPDEPAGPKPPVTLSGGKPKRPLESEGSGGKPAASECRRGKGGGKLELCRTSAERQVGEEEKSRPRAASGAYTTDGGSSGSR